MNVLMLFVGDANPGGRKERDTDGERGLPAVQVTHVTGATKGRQTAERVCRLGHGTSPDRTQDKFSLALGERGEERELTSLEPSHLSFSTGQSLPDKEFTFSHFQ